MKKRIISLLCAVLMLTAVCVPAFAADVNEVDNEKTSSITRASEYAHVNAYGVAFRAVEVSPYTAEKHQKIMQLFVLSIKEIVCSLSI